MNFLTTTPQERCYPHVLRKQVQKEVCYVLKWVCVQSLSHVRLSVTSWAVACRAPLSMDFQGKHPGVGCHFLLQGTVLTQGSNPCLAQLEHWEVASLPRSHMGSPTLSQTTAQNPSDFVPFLTASNSLEDAFGDRVYWDT